MKFLKYRILPIVCVLLILASSCVTSALATWDTSRDILDSETVGYWEACLTTPAHLTAYQTVLGNTSVSDLFWNIVDTMIGLNVGEVGIDDLEELCAQYNYCFNRPNAESFLQQLHSGSQEFLNDIVSLAFLGVVPTFEVRSWGTSGFQRIYCPELDAYVVSSTGRYAYANEAYSVQKEW